MRIVPKMLIALLCVTLSLCHEAGAKGRTIFELLPQVSGNFFYDEVLVSHNRTIVSSVTMPTVGGTMTMTCNVTLTLKHVYDTTGYRYTMVNNLVYNSVSYAYSSPSAPIYELPGGVLTLSSSFCMLTGSARVNFVASTIPMFDFGYEHRLNFTSVGPGMTPNISPYFAITGVWNLP